MTARFPHSVHQDPALWAQEATCLPPPLSPAVPTLPPRHPRPSPGGSCPAGSRGSSVRCHRADTGRPRRGPLASAPPRGGPARGDRSLHTPRSGTWEGGGRPLPREWLAQVTCPSWLPWSKGFPRTWTFGDKTGKVLGQLRLGHPISQTLSLHPRNCSWLGRGAWKDPWPVSPIPKGAGQADSATPPRASPRSLQRLGVQTKDPYPPVDLSSCIKSSLQPL